MVLKEHSYGYFVGAVEREREHNTWYMSLTFVVPEGMQILNAPCMYFWRGLQIIFIQP